MKNNNNSFYMLFAKPLISSSPNLPRQILALQHYSLITYYACLIHFSVFEV